MQLWVGFVVNKNTFLKSCSKKVKSSRYNKWKRRGMDKMDNGKMRASSFPPNWRLGILILYCQHSIPSFHHIHIASILCYVLVWNIYLCGVFCTNLVYMFLKSW